MELLYRRAEYSFGKVEEELGTSCNENKVITALQI